MLLRDDGRGVLAIGQASHAWISGQLARAWGNARFPAPEPWEEVCLAAEQHDVGMSVWDLEPSRDPNTGLPYSFMDMPLGTHIELWREAPRQLIGQSRYAALLVSMHGSRLYRRRDLDRLSDAEAAAVRGYLAGQRRLQRQLVSSLAADPLSADCVEEPWLARNSQLLWTWDFLSLAICLDWSPRAVSAVPARHGAVEMQLSVDSGKGRLRLEPWPFEADVIAVWCEGRRLDRRGYAGDRALRSALGSAPWEMARFELAAD